MKKNKKLYAILTLVAFMMTLMPVMAFAAASTSTAAVTPFTAGTDVVDVTAAAAGEKITLPWAVSTTGHTNATLVAGDANSVTATAAGAVAIKLEAPVRIANTYNVVVQTATPTGEDAKTISAVVNPAEAKIETSTVTVSDATADVNENVTVYVQLKDAFGNATKDLGANNKLVVWAERANVDSLSGIDFGSQVYATPVSTETVATSFTTAQAGKVTYKAGIANVTTASGAATQSDVDTVKTAKAWITASDNITTFEGTSVSKNNWVIGLSGTKGSTAPASDTNLIPVPAVNPTHYTLQKTANGLHEMEITVELKENVTNNTLAGEKLTFSSNKVGVNLSKETATTNSIGQAKFKVSVEKVGDYEVYVEAGNQKMTIYLTASSAGVGQIALASTFDNAVAVDNEAKIKFALKDSNGDVMSFNDSSSTNHPLAAEVLVKPSGSKVKDTIPTSNLSQKDDKIVVGFTPDKAGRYEVKLYNTGTGKYATASFEAAEQGKIVKMEVSYDADTVNVGGKSSTATVKLFDAAGISSETTTFVKYAANGKGFGGFVNSTDGQFTVSTDDKYAGEKITITAVNTKYNVSATTEVTIASEAQSVAFVTTNGVTGTEAKVPFSVVDADGNKVALGTNVSANDVRATATVVGAPDSAKASASISNLADLNSKGVATLNVTSNKDGVVKVQVMVEADYIVNNLPVTKYYTGVTEVNFGEKAAAVTDTITMITGQTMFVAGGKAMVSPVAPFVQNDRTYLPMRALAEAIGAEIAWDQATQTVTLTSGKTVTTFVYGSSIVTVNGVATDMGTPVIAVDNYTVLPVRFAAEAVGYNVDYTTDDKGVTTVTLTK